MSEAFIGSGISYPLRLDPSGGVALSSGAQDVEESIRLILGTAPGERPMRPDFGCTVHEHVFSPSDAGTSGAVALAVGDALTRWEPRVELIHVDVDLSAQAMGCLRVELTYRIRGSYDRRNLVFPFYVIPQE